MPVTISIRADMKVLERKLDDFTAKQLPFATALALTNLAKLVQAGERRRDTSKAHISTSPLEDRVEHRANECRHAGDADDHREVAP